MYKTHNYMLKHDGPQRPHMKWPKRYQTSNE